MTPTPTPIHPRALVDPGWLDDHLDDPDVRVVEIDVGPAAYNEGHIHNAVLWNIYRDLKDTDYRLIDSVGVQALLERSGIAPDTTVVFYGYAPAVGVWLLELYGHRDARVLNCGRAAWQREGRAWSTAPTTPPISRYPFTSEDPRIRVDRATVEAAIGDPRCTIADVRSEAEYRGERFWPSGANEPGGRAGHVPGSVHVPVDGVVDEEGCFRDVSDLTSLFSSIDLESQDELIVYCTIGGRAATAWFVLTHLMGRAHVQVYDGSWAEWGRCPDTPVTSSVERHHDVGDTNP